MTGLVLRLLGLLLRLLVFVVTGEWPSDRDEPAAPQAKSKAKVRPPYAKANRSRELELEAAGRAQRATPATARVLADVDTAVAALADPIITHAASQGIELTPTRFLSLIEAPPAQPNESAATGSLVPVIVGSNFADAPERWVLLARQVGRRMFEAVPGWAAETYRAHRLPPSLFLPPGHAAYDADTARAALGVWLPDLFADAYATHMLGPAYASVLGASLARAKQPMDALIARAQGRFLAPLPPAFVRMHVVTAVLQRLGLHDWNRKVRLRWELAHGTPDALYLPLSDGRLMAIPLSFMLGELDQVLVTLLDEPQVALAQETWLDIPGFAYLHAEHAQAERVAEAFARGEAVDAPARVLIAAAALALDEGARNRSWVAKALSRSIRGAGTLEAAPNAYDVASARHGHPSLASAFRDRALVREALVIGAVFAPVKPRRFRS